MSIKKQEKGRDSIFDGIPASLPSLLYAHKVLRKAQTLGVELPMPAELSTADWTSIPKPRCAPPPTNSVIERALLRNRGRHLDVD